jgi:hypothetical protein
MTSVDADRISRLISARCPEMSPSDILAVEAALTGSGDATLPREVAERIAEVLDALDERFAAMDSRLDAMEEGS